MMMMTAKVNIKKLLIALAAVAALIVALVSLLGGEKPQDTVATMSDNDSRVQFLEEQGWQVTTSPRESGQVKIPAEPSPLYSRYNDLQKSQGYDLTEYAGKTVMRYVYEVTNYPDAQQPVYATVLVYKNKIIGGDITNTAANGAVQGIKNPGSTMETQSAPTESSAPAESSIPTE